MIKKFAKLIPDSIQSKSGAVFYSGQKAFSNSSKLYVLGLNPGGSPEDLNCPTISDHTNSVFNGKPADWSEYTDEIWSGNVPGKSGLQPRITHLLTQLALNPHRVPCSNVVFVRSTVEENIKNTFNELAEECWPFHQKVIETLNIDIILCFGQTAGIWVRNKLNAKKEIDSFVENNNRRWKSAAYVNSQGTKVIVAAHPSRADWTSPASDPSSLIKRIMSLTS